MTNYVRVALAAAVAVALAAFGAGPASADNFKCFEACVEKKCPELGQCYQGCRASPNPVACAKACSQKHKPCTERCNKKCGD